MEPLFYVEAPLLHHDDNIFIPWLTFIGKTIKTKSIFPLKVYFHLKYLVVMVDAVGKFSMVLVRGTMVYRQCKVYLPHTQFASAYTKSLSLPMWWECASLSAKLSCDDVDDGIMVYAHPYTKLTQT